MHDADALSDAEFAVAAAHGRVHRFGHREHVRLAFVLVSQQGLDRGTQRVREILAGMAAAHGQPERFHVTLTMSWVRAVAHHMTLAPELIRFDDFIERFPRLLERDLMDAHYTRRRMFSQRARRTELAPDRRPIPA